MTNMAQHINEMKRKHEHTVRIQEIQSLLVGWEGADFTTYGDLVLEVWYEYVLNHCMQCMNTCVHAYIHLDVLTLHLHIQGSL